MTSVLFERRRASYQLFAYQTYDSAALAHGDTLRDLQRFLHHAGIVGPAAEQVALGAIRQQMDIEAVAVGFQSSFLLCLLLVSQPADAVSLLEPALEALREAITMFAFSPLDTQNHVLYTDSLLALEVKSV